MHICQTACHIYRGSGYCSHQCSCMYEEGASQLALTCRMNFLWVPTSRTIMIAYISASYSDILKKARSSCPQCRQSLLFMKLVPRESSFKVAVMYIHWTLTTISCPSLEIIYSRLTTTKCSSYFSFDIIKAYTIEAAFRAPLCNYSCLFHCCFPFFYAAVKHYSIIFDFGTSAVLCSLNLARHSSIASGVAVPPFPCPLE